MKEIISNLAQVERFELSHRGFKGPCLTAWLYLYIVYFAPESRFSTEDIQLISETDRTWLILFIVLLPLRSTHTKGETFHVYHWETNVSLEWAGVIETLSPEPEAGVLPLNYAHILKIHVSLNFMN